MILVTGANGLVGSYVTHLLLAQNKKLRLLLRKNANIELIKDALPSTDVMEGNILDFNILEKSFEGIETVIHCAAVVSFDNKETEVMEISNIEGTKNIVNMALSKNVRLIYLSSIAAIGRPEKSNIITENTQWTNSNFNSMYAQTKYMAELEVWRGIEEGLRAVMVNPSVILGVGDWNKSSTKILKTVADGLMAFPTGSINLVDVRDVAKAIGILVDNAIVGERYILNGHNLSYEVFFKQLALHLGVKPPRYKLSKNITLIFYFLSFPFLGWYYRKKFINRETIVITNSHFEYQNQKFVNQFDFKYTEWDKTLAWAGQGIKQKYLSGK